MNSNSRIASEEKSISEVLRQTGLKFPAYQRPYEWQSAINRQCFTDLTSPNLYYSTARTSEERETKLLADLTARVQLSHQTLIGLP